MRMRWEDHYTDESYDDGQWHFIHSPERSARPWLLIRETPFVYQRFTTLDEAITFSQQFELDHITEPTA